MTTSRSLLDTIQNYRPLETGWGIGANTLIEMIPALSRAGGRSRGKNLAYTLGAGLLGGLLTGLARSDANERNVELYKSARAFRGAEPEERVALVEANPRLIDYASTLEDMEYEQSLARAQAAYDQDIADRRLARQTVFNQYPQLAINEAGLADALVQGSNLTSVEDREAQRELDMFRAKEQIKQETKHGTNLAGLPESTQQLLGQVPEKFQIKVFDALGKREQEDKSLADINRMFDEAMEISSIGSMLPYTEADAKMSSIRSSGLLGMYQIAGKQISDRELKVQEKLLPHPLDSTERLQIKKRELLNFLNKNRGSDVLLRSFNINLDDTGSSIGGGLSDQQALVSAESDRRARLEELRAKKMEEEGQSSDFYGGGF